MADYGAHKLGPWTNRAGGCGKRRAVAALALLIVLCGSWAGSSIAAQQPRTDLAPVYSSLFERRPLGFNQRTADKIGAAIRDLPDEIPRLINFGRSQRHVLGRGGSQLMLLLGIAIAWGIFGRAAVVRRVKQTLAPLSDRVSADAELWLAALSELIAAVVLPLALWGLWALVRALSGGFHGPLFMFVGQLLRAWVVYSSLLIAMRELMVRPLLPISAEHGRYIFGFGRLLLAYGIALSVCTDLIADFGAPPDVVALLGAALRLSLIVLLAAMTMRKRAVLALFPKMPNLLYRGFVAGLDRLYPAVWLATVAVALIQLAGFVALANFLWTRTWLPAGVFLAAAAVYHLSDQALRRSLLADDAQRDNALALYRSLTRVLGYVIALAALAFVFHRIGAVHPLYSIAAQPVLTLGAKTVSVLVLLQAAVIVSVFGLSARLIRDYCEFRVYPQLNIDPGVANAINTFIVYVIVAIGILASVEAVGLGLSTITLFAGALGIGLGMGLQSMANNLTSGLTLIFTRALRKGDVVTAGDTRGIIQEVGIRATRMKTPDAVEYLVPNSQFVDGKVVNWTRSDPYTRLHVSIGVSYDASPEVVRAIMGEVACSTPNVQPDPPPEVWFAGLGDSSLNFELLLWINVKEVEPERVRSDLYFALFQALKEAGIEIPFPQRDIHIRTTEVIPLKRG